MRNKRIYLDLDRCCGCKSCAAACSYAYYDHSNVSHSPVDEKALLPMICMHCELAACAESCPTGALKKNEDGVVRRSSFLCVGCNSCISACPVGVIPSKLKYSVPAKCDLCSDRLLEDKVPRCVASCTSGALSARDVDELSGDKAANWVSGRMVSISPTRRR